MLNLSKLIRIIFAVLTVIYIFLMMRIAKNPYRISKFGSAISESENYKTLLIQQPIGNADNENIHGNLDFEAKTNQALPDNAQNSLSSFTNIVSNEVVSHPETKKPLEFLKHEEQEQNPQLVHSP